MTDSLTGKVRDHGRGQTPVLLILLSFAALGVFLVVLRPSQAIVLSLLAFGLALGAGVAVGRWWPRTEAVTSDEDEVESIEPAAVPGEPVSEAAASESEIALEKACAMAEEEHIVVVDQSEAEPAATGCEETEAAAQIAADAAQDVRDEAADDVVVESTADETEQAAGPKAEVAQRDSEQANTATADDGIDTRATASAAPAGPESAETESQEQLPAIDEASVKAALAAKDEMIESLEDIVKENRDRWGNFELEREALDRKIRKLEDELRIASQIIEGSRDTGDGEALEQPQVLSRA